jgi:uncharacterized membrane protein (UPF0127 family)
MRRLGALSLIAVLPLSACTHSGRPSSGRVVFDTVQGRVRTGTVTVADTPSEREHGLMGVSHLGTNQGMVFLFDGPTTSSFWMKDTLVPLSVAFWSGDGKVVDVLDMQPCTSDPCPLYTPDSAYTTALEMNVGWFEGHDITSGDHAAFSPSGS